MYYVCVCVCVWCGDVCACVCRKGAPLWVSVCLCIVPEHVCVHACVQAQTENKRERERKKKERDRTVWKGVQVGACVYGLTECVVHAGACAPVGACVCVHYGLWCVQISKSSLLLCHINFNWPSVLAQFREGSSMGLFGKKRVYSHLHFHYDIIKYGLSGFQLFLTFCH